MDKRGELLQLPLREVCPRANGLGKSSSSFPKIENQERTRRERISSIKNSGFHIFPRASSEPVRTYGHISFISRTHHMHVHASSYISSSVRVLSLFARHFSLPLMSHEIPAFLTNILIFCTNAFHKSQILPMCFQCLVRLFSASCSSHVFVACFQYFSHTYLSPTVFAFFHYSSRTSNVFCVIPDNISYTFPPVSIYFQHFHYISTYVPCFPEHSQAPSRTSPEFFRNQSVFPVLPCPTISMLISTPRTVIHRLKLEPYRLETTPAK